MDNARKKELVRSFKEQKARPGVFAVRCTATGQAWTYASKDLDRQKSGLWFQLRMGGFPGKTLQAAWKAQGEDAFVFEELEEITDDNALLIPALLKERELHWRNELGAEPLI